MLTYKNPPNVFFFFFSRNCDCKNVFNDFSPTNYDYTNLEDIFFTNCDCKNVHDEFFYLANYNSRNCPNEFFFFSTHCDFLKV